LLPVFPLVNVRGAELPVLVRLIDTLKESLPLFFVRKVEEYLDNPRAVTMKVLLQVHDGAIPLLPNDLLVAQFLGKPLAAKKLRMYPNDEHFFVVRPIEDTDAAAFGKAARAAPEKIMLEFLGAGLLETEDLAALRIDAGHDVPDA
jgi:hypothetical protein